MSDNTQGPGELLKAAREALNVSEREVADALNLPLNVIQAMEADDFQALPPPVFTRGYVRSYARLLELDDDELVERLPAPAEDAVALTGEMAAVNPKPLPVDRSLLLGGGIAVAVLLVILLVVGLGSEDEQAADSQRPAVAEQPVVDTESIAVDADTPQTPAVEPVDPLPQPSQPELNRDAEQRSSQNEPEVVSSAAPVDSTPLPAEASASAAAPDPSQQLAPAAASQAQTDSNSAQLSDPTPAGMRRITPFGDDVLTISFTEDCWVDVKDRAGTRLFGDLIRGGRTIALIGNAPFQILLGYAPGAQLRFNGEVIDLNEVTRNNVARLTVGD